MDFKFIDKDWAKIFKEISGRNTKEYKFVTPFLQLKTIEEILNKRKLKLKLITRYNLTDFYNGVSSLDAIEYILKNGGQIKGIKNLHSKLYIFDSKEAILSSANLTQAALLTNFEFGMHTYNADAIFSLEAYFDSLWNKIPLTLEQKQIDQWRMEIDSSLQSGKESYQKYKFKDYGFSVNNKPNEQAQSSVQKTSDSNQYFIKFFGEGSNRTDINMQIIEEVGISGCHWACTYPTKKKPRIVDNGAIMFIGRMVSNPNDIIIYGHAIGNKYKENRDDASDEDIKRRPWKKKWSRYIRVHDAKLINGTLKNGVSMNELMDKFGYNSFVSTLRNKISGKGNIDPREAYHRQAAVQLTQDSANWLMEKLENKLKYFGRISDSALSQIP
ncbi:MAG: hypothetical protein A2Z50_03425 [Nitrospirae bacterium RBG_19FT_COMBO_42_15]|nr:MAG: hypothetical protein A2Z50_03425 [Nitrospirae bacterium RBG_19FT_COMBO_42_15]